MRRFELRCIGALRHAMERFFRRPPRKFGPTGTDRYAMELARWRKTAFRTALVVWASTAALLFAASELQANAGEAHERRVTLYDGGGIVELARKQLGVRYQSGGESPSGFDCSGLVQYVYKKAGHQAPRTTTAQYAELTPLRVPRPGDLVFFRTSGDSSISHVGIYVGDFRFIHAPRTGKFVEYADVRTSYWKQRYAGARTIFRGKN